MSRTSLPKTNYDHRDRGPGHVTDFGILRPYGISEMVEVADLRNSVCGWSSEIPACGRQIPQSVRGWAQGRFRNFWTPCSSLEQVKLGT